MLAIARAQGLPWPSAAQWRHSALVGGLMAFGAMSMVVLAQKLGIGCGLRATVVTTVPITFPKISAALRKMNSSRASG